MSGRKSSRSGTVLNLPLKFLVVDLDPVGKPDLLGDLQRALDTQLLARLLAH